MESFDKNINRLEEIVKKLDTENSIEQAMKLFNEGVKLCEECQDYINKSNENILKVEK